ncbi:Long chain acyl-CoA synthetase 7 peroxisomal [Boothiomyces sp. JEL0866]|nr:Long chain acyl-CoA synthetase 7 peroxisomal [Boothiomyces sp. JEL0866]
MNNQVVISLLAVKPEPDVHPAAFREQAVATRTRKPHESAIYRNKNKYHGTPLLDTLGDKPTVYAMFWDAVKEFREKPFISQKEKIFSFAKIAERVEAFGKGLVDIVKLNPKSVANRDTISTQFVACITYGLVSIPLYESFDGDDLHYILNHIELKCIITSTKSLEKILDSCAKGNSIRYIILSDLTEIDEENRDKAQLVGVKLVSFKQLEVTGKEIQKSHFIPEPNDIFTICFTSGTTGEPKGAMISHRNLVAQAAGTLDLIPIKHRIQQSDKHISFMPMSLMFERLNLHTIASQGCQIEVFDGSSSELIEYLEHFKPTIFLSVPLVINKLHDRIQQKAETLPFLYKFLFGLSFKRKKMMLENGILKRNSIYDQLIFNKFQKAIGGNVRLIVSGGAPINPMVTEYLRIIFGANVLQGYGLTETCAGGFVTQFGDYDQSYGCHVGVPLSSVEYKLIDIPELGYLVTDTPNPRGQICIRGPGVVCGYYKNEVKSKQAITDDGWLLTGDVGEILENSTLKIIDRLHNIIKLSQGEFVALNSIASKLKCPHFSQIYVHGESLQSFLIAVVVPDKHLLVSWAKSNSIPDDYNSLVKSSKVKEMLLEKLKEQAVIMKMRRIEIPKDILVEGEPFSVENELLTPTLKNKPRAFYAKYGSEFKKIVFNLRYTSSKIVVVKDFRLALIYYTALILITAYIIYNMISSGSYLELLTPVGGSVRTTIKFGLPISTNIPAYCTPGLYNPDGCIFWTPDQIVYPYSGEQGVLFITTRVSITNVPAPSSCSLSIPTSRDCSGINVKGVKKTYFVSDVESLTIQVDHTVRVQSTYGFGSAAFRTVASQNMTGQIDRSCDKGPLGFGVYDNNYRTARPFNTSLDIVSFSQLMESGFCDKGNFSFDALSTADSAGPGEPIRSNGLIVSMPISYSNAGGDITYKYLPANIAGSYFKLTQIEYNADGSYTVYDRHGIRFILVQTGTIGIFNFIALVMNFVAGLALFSIAGTLVDFLMIHFLPDRRNYVEAKFEGIHKFDIETEDFLRAVQREVERRATKPENDANLVVVKSQ